MLIMALAIGPFAHALLTVSVNSVVNSRCGATNGSVSITVSGGTPPYSFLWSNGQTAQNLAGVVPGLYSVTVHDAMAATATGSWAVGNNTMLNAVPTIEATQGIHCPNSGGGLNTSLLGGTPPYTFSYPPSSYLPGGTYAIWNYISNNGQIQVTDANGCPGVVNTLISQVTGPYIYNITTLPSCNSQATGSVTFQLGNFPNWYMFTNSVELRNGANQIIAQFSPYEIGTHTSPNLAAGNYTIRSAATRMLLELTCTEEFYYPFTIAGNAPNCNEVNLTLRAEAFNLYNRVQFGTPKTQASTAATSNFGQVTSQANQPRLLQLAARLSF